MLPGGQEDLDLLQGLVEVTLEMMMRDRQTQDVGDDSGEEVATAGADVHLQLLERDGQV